MVDLTPLIQQLSGDDLEARRAAAESLAQLGEEAAPAALALLGACHVNDEPLREWVVAALEQLGVPRVEDLPTICQQLATDHELAAYWSATLLGRLQERAAAAVGPLGDAIESSEHPPVCQRAVWALGQIGPAACEASKQLLEASVCSDPRTARLASDTLRRLKIAE